jgi:hypothetical protein
MNPAPDGDEVEFYASAGLAGAVTVVLRSGPAVTWWKGIKVFGNGSWNAIGLVETQDHSHGPVAVTLDLGDFIEGQSRLEFWKGRHSASTLI